MRRVGGRAGRLTVAMTAGMVAVLASSAGAQETRQVPLPVLRGTVLLGDSAMTRGTVVLHHLAPDTQGELDSLALAGEGVFEFRLPSAPDPDRSDVFFTSVRHDGVLYFGPAITSLAQLDSAYVVQVYDTLVAPAQGAALALQSRSIFFEPDSAGWRVTDLFQVRNDENRTVVMRPGGRVWSHPLPEEARNVVAGEGELAFAAAEYEDGALVVRAALPPGERLFVVRYQVNDLDLAIPNVGPAEGLDVLIREPAPPVEVPSLELLDRIELEAGSTYLRFTGADVVASPIRVIPGEEASPPRVEWVAFLLAIVLGMGGLLVLRPGAGSTAPVEPPPDRAALLWQIAQLDEDFQAGTEPTPEEARLYRRRRAELLRRVQELR